MSGGSGPELAARAVDRLLVFVLAGSALVIPLFVYPGAKEPFREPKAILLHIAALLIASLLAWRWALGGPLSMARRPAIVLGGILLWTLITTLTSTNPILSREAFWHAAAAALLFTAATITGREAGHAILGATLLAAVPVAIVAILQATALWSPFEFALPLGTRTTVTSFLGNPNDVGGWLVVPALIAVAAAFILSGWSRWTGMVAFGVISLGIFITSSVTAILSLLISAAWIVARALPKRRSGVVILALLLLCGLAWGAARQTRLLAKAEAAAEGGIAGLLDVRLMGWTTATMMLRDHPLLGVGPGTYGWNYLDYQAAAQESHEPFQMLRYRTGAFEQVHNDYLEAGAETGVPGILLIAVSFWTFLFPGGTYDGSLTAQFARLLAGPLLLSLAIQMIGNFPLQLSALLASYLLIGGALLSCRTH